MENKNYTGHFTAALTILIWGTTFISTKSFWRFSACGNTGFSIYTGICDPAAAQPKKIKNQRTWGRAIVCRGRFIRDLPLLSSENIALTYTLASNVGVIISVAPFFTAILAHLFMREEEKHAI